MAMPKRKKSKMKKRQMKAGKPYFGVQANYCTSCGNPVLAHRVCKACGIYSGKQTITPKVKQAKQQA